MDVQRVGDVVDAAARLLGVPVTLEDRALRLIAYAAHGDEVDDVRRETILTRRTPPAVRDHLGRHGLEAATGPVRIPASPEAGLGARVCVPIRSGDVLYGHLWAPDEPVPLSEALLTELAPLAAQAGELLAAAARGRTERGRLLRDLVAEPMETRLDAAARLSGMALLQPGRPLAIAAVAPPPAPTAPAAPAAPPIAPAARAAPAKSTLGGPPAGEAGPGASTSGGPASGGLPGGSASGGLPAGFLAHLPGDLPAGVVVAADRTPAVLLVPLPADGDLTPVHAAARALCQDPAGEAAGGRWGIGTPRTETAALAEAWREALDALRAATADPALRPGASWPELGAYRLLTRLDPAALRAAADGPARRLVEAGDAELLRTVESYLGHAGRVQACARDLAVHRQTLYYRLEKAARVTGVDLAAGDARLDLHLGLKAARLAGLGSWDQVPAEAPGAGELPQRVTPIP